MKINIMYSMLCREFHELVTERIKNKFNVGNQIAITEMYAGNVSDFNDTFECGDVYYGWYYKYKEYTDIPPVDEEIINKMAPYALEILKMMDRPQSWGMDFEDRMQLYFEHIRFWNYILDLYEINHIIFFNVPHEVVDLVIYYLCILKNIKMCIIYGALPIKNRILVCDNLETLGNEIPTRIEEIKKEMLETGKKDIFLEKDCEKAFRNYMNVKKYARSNPKSYKIPWKGTSQNKNLKYMTYMDIRHKIEETYSERINGVEVAKKIAEYDNDLEKKIIKKKWIFDKYIKTMKLWDYYEKLTEKPNKREKYILYCLHYQPEATSAPLGGGIFSNQLIAIKLLADNLPDNVYLYVKEHPNQIYVARTKAFYDKIQRIKNVKLISKNVNQYSLIKNSIATATLTGTVAIESIVIGKPCITMGKFIYNYLEGVFNVRTNEQCKLAIDKILKKEYTVEEKNIKIFFKALYDISFSGNSGYGNYNLVSNANKVAEVLEYKIRQDNE